ncbi:hypothetical protein [Virgibacillus ainsalahensis]
MENNHVEVCDCYIGVDRMINEGLGAGFIYYDNDKKKLEPKQAAYKKSTGKRENEE